MNNSPYLLVRNHSGVLKVINEATDLKSSFYSLNHFAKEDDAVFLTPSSPFYRGNGSPTYMCNLSHTGRIEFNENHWRTNLEILQEVYKFEYTTANETKIITLPNCDFNAKCNWPLNFTDTELTNDNQESDIRFFVTARA